MTNTVDSCANLALSYAAIGGDAHAKAEPGVACMVWLILACARALASRCLCPALWSDGEWNTFLRFWLCVLSTCTDNRSAKTHRRPAPFTVKLYQLKCFKFLLAGAVEDIRALDGNEIVSVVAAATLILIASLAIQHLPSVFRLRWSFKLWSKTRMISHGVKSTRVAFSLLLILSLVSPTAAALTHAQCVENNCIQLSAGRTMCYYPGSTDTWYSRSPDRCVSLQLRRMRDFHRSGSAPAASIIYYEIRTHKPLGDASFSFERPGPNADIVACATGALSSATDSNLYQTRCWFPETNEDMGAPDGDRACSIVHERSRSIEHECDLGAVEKPRSWLMGLV